MQSCGKKLLESLLVDCLRKQARAMPLLLVLEDCHWLDPLSHDLLEVIGRAIADLPVLIVLAYRPSQPDRVLAPRVHQLLYFKEISLTDLPPEEIEQLVAFKLGQLYGEAATLPKALIEKISLRAEGNPFYIEEFLNYLHDRDIDPQQPEALAQIDLPDSLYSLILSRMDQLTENQKTILKVASVIGRLFRAAMLWGVYNQFGGQERVQKDLDALSALDLTPLDTPEPELAYLFKHILTQEVAYETLSFATRALLHDQIGQYIENNYQEVLDQYVDLLAYHFERSENQPKKCEYLLKAAEVAQVTMPMLRQLHIISGYCTCYPRSQRVVGLLKLGQVLELVGEWENAEGINRRGREAGKPHQ